MANALLYYLIVINVVTFLVYGIEAHFGGNFIDIGCYRWQHWCIAGYASLASQDDA